MRTEIHVSVKGSEPSIVRLQPNSLVQVFSSGRDDEDDIAENGALMGVLYTDSDNVVSPDSWVFDSSGGAKEPRPPEYKSAEEAGGTVFSEAPIVGADLRIPPEETPQPTKPVDQPKASKPGKKKSK